jgi:hypothetical protein
MNIMPILCRRRSASISHNIAQERQARVGHIPCNSVTLVRTRPSQGSAIDAMVSTYVEHAEPKPEQSQPAVANEQ